MDDGAPTLKFTARAVLARVGPRLRTLRGQRSMTLASLAAASGISESTLSRVESGHRRPSLEVLLRLAHAHQVPLEELVDAPPTGDPRTHLRPMEVRGMTVVPLTREPGGIQAYKLLVPVRTPAQQPDLRAHDGHSSIHVLSGRVRLLVGEDDVTLAAGEVAEVDTRTPHWFGATGPQPAEVLAFFSAQGQRMRLRVQATATS